MIYYVESIQYRLCCTDCNTTLTDTIKYLFSIIGYDSQSPTSGKIILHVCKSIKLIHSFSNILPKTDEITESYRVTIPVIFNELNYEEIIKWLPIFHLQQFFQIIRAYIRTPSMALYRILYVYQSIRLFTYRYLSTSHVFSTRIQPKYLCRKLFFFYQKYRKTYLCSFTMLTYCGTLIHTVVKGFCNSHIDILQSHLAHLQVCKKVFLAYKLCKIISFAKISR